MAPILFPLWIMAMFSGLWALNTINPEPVPFQAGNQQVQALAQAQWLFQYRDAVVSWALANPGFTGAVSNSALVLPGITLSGVMANQAGGWVMGPVNARTVVAYAAVLPMALASLDSSFAQVAGGSWMGPTTSVALPQSLINQLPGGAVVSLTQLGGV
jgi:hypothetical protein